MFRNFVAVGRPAALPLAPAVARPAPSAVLQDAGRRRRPRAVCNPYIGADWSMPHRNGYEQDSTPYAGPTAATRLTAQHVTVPNGALAFLQFSPSTATAAAPRGSDGQQPGRRARRQDRHQPAG